jgi:hypothetical protein
MAKKLEQAALDGNGPTYVSRDSAFVRLCWSKTSAQVSGSVQRRLAAPEGV